MTLFETLDAAADKLQDLLDPHRAHDDTIGADNTYTFTIAQLLANDTNAKANTFFFGDGLDVIQQAKYMQDHMIIKNADGSYTATAGHDFEYSVLTGTGFKLAYSSADVDVKDAPVSHVGASLFVENFDTQTTDPVAALVNLRTESTDPDTGVTTVDPNGWLLDNNTLGKGLTKQIVNDDVGGVHASSGDYWLNTEFTSFEPVKQAAKGGGDLTHTFNDTDGGKDQISFDISVQDFTRTASNGNVNHFYVNSDDSFDFKIDGVSVYHATAQDIHNAVGDNAMLHVSLLLDVGAPGTHILGLSSTVGDNDTHSIIEGQEGTTANPYQEHVGFAVDSIHINNWIV